MASIYRVIDAHDRKVRTLKVRLDKLARSHEWHTADYALGHAKNTIAAARKAGEAAVMPDVEAAVRDAAKAVAAAEKNAAR